MMTADGELPAELSKLQKGYDLLGELSREDLVTIYLARDRLSGKEVAIKVLRTADARGRERLALYASDARMLTALEHPNIVGVHSVKWLSEDVVAVVTERVRGPSLRQVLDVAGTLPVARATEVLRGLGRALAWAHSTQIMHRDLRPENVIFEDGTGRVVLSDFGLARRVDGGGGTNEEGPNAYRAPELRDGRYPDRRSDVYSLGVIGWELLTGRRPWPDDMESIAPGERAPAPPSLAEVRPGLPPALVAAIEGAVQLDRDRRIADVVSFMERLTKVAPPRPEPEEVEVDPLAFEPTEWVALPVPRIPKQAPPAEDRTDVGLDTSSEPVSERAVAAPVAGRPETDGTVGGEAARQSDRKADQPAGRATHREGDREQERRAERDTQSGAAEPIERSPAFETPAPAGGAMEPAATSATGGAPFAPFPMPTDSRKRRLRKAHESASPVIPPVAASPAETPAAPTDRLTSTGVEQFSRESAEPPRERAELRADASSKERATVGPSAAPREAPIPPVGSTTSGVVGGALAAGAAAAAASAPAAADDTPVAGSVGAAGARAATELPRSVPADSSLADSSTAEPPRARRSAPEKPVTERLGRVPSDVELPPPEPVSFADLQAEPVTGPISGPVRGPSRGPARFEPGMRGGLGTPRVSKARQRGHEASSGAPSVPPLQPMWDTPAEFPLPVMPDPRPMPADAVGEGDGSARRRVTRRGVVIGAAIALAIIAAITLARMERAPDTTAGLIEPESPIGYGGDVVLDPRAADSVGVAGTASARPGGGAASRPRSTTAGGAASAGSDGERRRAVPPVTDTRVDTAGAARRGQPRAPAASRPAQQPTPIPPAGAATASPRAAAPPARTPNTSARAGAGGGAASGTANARTRETAAVDPSGRAADSRVAATGCNSPALADQRACLAAHIARSDAELNDTYGEVIAAMRQRASTAVGDPDPPEVQRLRARQRNWLARRDAECRRRGRGREGPLWATARARCLDEFSAERSRELTATLARLRRD